MTRLSIVVIMLLALVGVAPTASALAPDFWGFAFLDKKTPGAGYVPDPNHQATNCNQKIVVDQVANGRYIVHSRVRPGWACRT